ncbi:hypothetical protein SSPIM334S_02158 [Streptomyces spiroverticillatus]|nr:hypothetical protein [Streptomyces finlayi]
MMNGNALHTLKALDPAGGSQVHASPTDRERLLANVLNTSRPAPGPAAGLLRRWRWPLAGVAVATSLAVAVSTYTLFGPNAQPAQAMTPPPLRYAPGSESPRAVLERLAVVALKDTSRVPAGSSLYLKHQGWALSTRIGQIQVTSAIVPSERETWKKADGSMRWKQRTLPPRFQNAHDEEVWSDAGAVGEDPQFTEDATGPVNANDPLNRPAPEEPRAMGKWLLASQEYAGTAEAFDSVAAHNLDELWNGRQRAAMLRFLATRTDVTYRGKVTDRAGRAGQAVSVDSAYGGLPTKYTLILDESNGKVLAYEEELTTTAGALNVKVPSVISYFCFLTARVD